MSDIKLPDLNKSMVIVYPTGRVTPAFQRFWQGVSLKAQQGALAHAELPGVVADVTQNAQAITTTQASVTSLTTTVTANYNGQQSQITSLQDAISGLDGVYGRYGVAITAGGQFAGFELMAGSGAAGGTVSSFKVASSQFVIDSPAGATQPFVYDAVNSRLTVQNVHVRGDLIVDGTVFNSALASAAVTSSKVQPNAITRGTAAAFPATTVLSPWSESVIATYNHTPTGRRVRLAWQFEVVNGDPVNEGNLRVEARVNGAAVRPYIAIIRQGTPEHRSFSANAYGTPGVAMTVELVGIIADPAASNLLSIDFVWLDIDDFGTES